MQRHGQIGFEETKVRLREFANDIVSNSAQLKGFLSKAEVA